MRGETLDVVRERVFKIIKGKKLVGYHLPQKMADFGLFDNDTVDCVLQDSSNSQTDAASYQQETKIPYYEAVPNPISPKK